MSARDIVGTTAAAPISTWPLDGLERVPCCPVCKSDSHALLYEGLTDRVFRCAPGVWSMYQCAECGFSVSRPAPHAGSERPCLPAVFHARGYDPRCYRRPLRGAAPAPSPREWLPELALRHGFSACERHRGTDSAARSRSAGDFGRVRPSPAPTSSRAALLDVGCGNGDFLDFARRAGWRAVGVEPDASAVSVARSRGLDVGLGGIEVVLDGNAAFDVITLSHVIEHVHDPVELLRGCHQLLKPGGFVWIETPNLGALGHQRYGSAWRGLETPRHLVLFDCSSLARVLTSAGFDQITPQPHRPQCMHIFTASEAIARGQDPYPGPLPHPGLRPSVRTLCRALLAEVAARKDPDKREFITVKAWKSA